MSRPFKVRDRRNRGWFFIDNDYINGYGKYFGAVGIAIYVTLCRHANQEQVCFPSQKHIAEKIGVTPRTVLKYLKKFVSFNMIHVEKERKRGKWMNNVYFLLDKDEWIVPSESISHGNQVKLKTSPCETDDSNHVNEVRTKDTNRKDTNIRKERKIKNQEERIQPIKKEIDNLVASFKV